MENGFICQRNKKNHRMRWFIWWIQWLLPWPAEQ